MEKKTSLGDYIIDKQIGQGALGNVFLAEHRFMKKLFALKIFPEDLSKDAGFIQRFESEVANLATLDHPNIVKLHNISQANGRYFLVSDCILDDNGDAMNLADFIVDEKNNLFEGEIYRLLVQIASALD